MKFHSKKAQASIEYMVIIIFLLVIVAFTSSYAFIIYNNTISSNQLQESMRDIKSAVKTVYYLGEGNAIPVEVKIPDGVSQIEIENNTILVSSNFFGVVSTDLIELDVNISGNIPNKVGNYRLILTNQNGIVNILED